MISSARSRLLYLFSRLLFRGNALQRGNAAHRTLLQLSRLHHVTAPLRQHSIHSLVFPFLFLFVLLLLIEVRGRGLESEASGKEVALGVHSEDVKKVLARAAVAESIQASERDTASTK